MKKNSLLSKSFRSQRTPSGKSPKSKSFESQCIPFSCSSTVPMFTTVRQTQNRILVLGWIHGAYLQNVIEDIILPSKLATVFQLVGEILWSKSILDGRGRRGWAIDQQYVSFLTQGDYLSNFCLKTCWAICSFMNLRPCLKKLRCNLNTNW